MWNNSRVWILYRYFLLPLSSSGSRHGSYSLNSLKIICVINLEPKPRVPPFKEGFHLSFPGGTNNLGSPQSKFKAWGYRSSSSYKPGVQVHTRAKVGLFLRVWLFGIPVYHEEGFLYNPSLCALTFICAACLGESAKQQFISARIRKCPQSKSDFPACLSI